MSIIIGIDPGSRITGYGIVHHRGDTLHFLEAGVIRTDSKDIPLRLQQIFAGLNRVIKQYQTLYANVPIESAIEQVFVGKNPSSALKLGQARGCAITALVANDLSVAEYSARQIKQAVCGHGGADKLQVQAMVCRILKLSETPSEDAADALACAICHAHSRHSVHALSSLNGDTTNNKPSVKTSKKTRKRARWSEEDLKKLQ